jgi:phage shock protein C
MDAAEVVEMQRRLYRSEQNRMVAGVCGGLAAYFDVDPTLVRIAFVLLALLHGLGLLLYLVMALLTPRESALEHVPPAVVRDNAGEYAGAAQAAAAGVREAFAGRGGSQPPPPPPGSSPPAPSADGEGSGAPPPAASVAPPSAARARGRGGLVVGGVLIGLGMLFLAHNLGWFWIDWGTYWPVILILIGIALIVRRT